MNATTVVTPETLKPRKELNPLRATNPEYPDWTKTEDFIFSIEKVIETKCSTANKLTWSRSRFHGKQMERSDDI